MPHATHIARCACFEFRYGATQKKSRPRAALSEVKGDLTSWIGLVDGVPSRVLSIADCFSGSALQLVQLSFSLKLRVAGQTTDCILHSALCLIDSTFDVLFIH